MLRLVACITQQHDVRLVVVSALVCILACAAALNLLGRALAAAGRNRAAWVGGAAIAFGGGVWATHFIAMLAYRPDMPFSISVPLTLISVVVAIIGSGTGFAVLVQSPRAAGAALVAGLMVGNSVAAMHFIAMSGEQPEFRIRFDETTVIISVLMGVVFACLALYAPCRERMALAAAMLALSVFGVHFIGMSAVTLDMLPGPPAFLGTTSFAPLAITIAVAAAVVLALCLIAALMDRRRASWLEAEAQRMRRLLDATFEGILFHRDGIVTEVNAQLCTLLGREAGTLVGREVAAILGGAVLLPEASGGGAIAVEAELPGGDGKPRSVELLARPLTDVGRGEYVVAVRDLTERRRAEQRIRHLAVHDPLTGLANRVLLADIAAQALSLADRAGHGVALLYLNLDGFKLINDLHGHVAGDALLAAVASRLASATRQMDTVARLGGDEFAILQPLADQPQSAATLAERTVRLLGHPFEVGGADVTIGASIGIALYPADALTFEQLLRDAGLALHRAKREGRGTFRFFESDVDEQVRERRQLQHDLRDALAGNELELHYQALFNGTRLDVVGYEALLRWTHPTRGRISPAEFIPVAEECGLIRQLGQWVLETACREAAGWPRPLRISVNLSPAQFRDIDLPQRVIETLASGGLAPERLELEITEGVLIDDADRALRILLQLKAHGVRMALDDFGTGYSSLSYLRRFPFDTLKIDKSFVQAIGQDAESDAIVRAVINLGHSLNLEVVAEGVETPQQSAFLRAQNCDLLQGFLLARPQPAAALVHAVAEPAQA